MGNSSIQLQSEVDVAQTFGDIAPVLNVAGASLQPALTIANNVMNAFLAEETPWKFNQILIPVFYTNNQQQDYAVPGLTTLAWLQGGIAIDINSGATPKPFRLIEVNRDQRQQTATTFTNAFQSPLFEVNWLPNDQLYYGVWGSNGASLGNDPVANSVYTSPLGAPSNPSNPITQIQDANGNLLVLTTYGHEGSAAPVLPAKSAAGTTVSGSGATTVWTVADPKGQGFRLSPPAPTSSIAWQIRLVGQARPVRFTSLSQYLDPIPDDFEPHFQAGFIAQCYRFSPEAKIRAKFKDEWALWLQSLAKARQKTEHERDEYGFVPDCSITGGGGRNTNAGYQGPLNPYWP
jgi:hypothetical protein